MLRAGNVLGAFSPTWLPLMLCMLCPCRPPAQERRKERERKRREREAAARRPKGRVVVVGAGPAGLTAALHLKVGGPLCPFSSFPPFFHASV